MIWIIILKFVEQYDSETLSPPIPKRLRLLANFDGEYLLSMLISGYKLQDRANVQYTIWLTEDGK